MLVALIIRHANVAAHGSAIKALDQAVTRLGAQKLKTLVIEYATHELFQSSNKRISDANVRIWEHSVCVALLARDLAAFAGGIDGNVCYLGGLLHDVGKPVLGAMLLEAERTLGNGRAGWVDHQMWTNTVDAGHRRGRRRTRGRLEAAGRGGPPRSRTAWTFDGNDRASAANVVRLANAIAKREGYVTGPIDANDVDTMIMGRALDAGRRRRT